MSSAKLSSRPDGRLRRLDQRQDPYAYNYANMTVGGYSTAQPHGTHVAGIVAGQQRRGLLRRGPEAQLLVMKVFDEQAPPATPP